MMKYNWRDCWYLDTLGCMLRYFMNKGNIKNCIMADIEFHQEKPKGIRLKYCPYMYDETTYQMQNVWNLHYDELYCPKCEPEVHEISQHNLKVCFKFEKGEKNGTKITV